MVWTATPLLIHKPGELFGFFPNRNHTATLLVMGTFAGLGSLAHAIRRKIFWKIVLSIIPIGVCLYALHVVSESRASQEYRRALPFIVPGTQYTLDDGSLEMEDYEIDDSDSGFAHCEFTASMYAGCRDVDDDCDPRDCVLDVAVNLSGRTITVSTTVPDNDRDPEEF